MIFQQWILYLSKERNTPVTGQCKYNSFLQLGTLIHSLKCMLEWQDTVLFIFLFIPCSSSPTPLAGNQWHNPKRNFQIFGYIHTIKSVSKQHQSTVSSGWSRGECLQLYHASSDHISPISESVPKTSSGRSVKALFLQWRRIIVLTAGRIN